MKLAHRMTQFRQPLRLSRRGFLLGLTPAAAAVRRPGKGFKVTSQSVKFLDPLTEREMFRLTDPKILHHLPHYHNRYISKRDTFMLVASERTGTRQIYRINLPDGDAEQLTEGNDVHPYSPFLSPNDRSIFLLQGNSLKEVSTGNGREKTIYSTPQGWRMTGHLALSSDGDLAALIEMQSGHMVDGFVEQYERKPRCRIVVVETGRNRRNWVAVEENVWLAHPQFRPGRREILYCHEGPWDKVDGRLRRITLDDRTKKNQLPRKANEQLGHEYWAGEGEEICFIYYPDETGRGCTIRGLNPDTGAVREISRCTRFGWMMGNADNSVIVGASKSLAGPNIYLLFAKIKRERTACEHGSRYNSYPVAGERTLDPFAADPEPVFSPDSRWVYFASDREGLPTIYRIKVEDLVETTEQT
jgi:oligogalacturonide lyase